MGCVAFLSTLENIAKKLSQFADIPKYTKLTLVLAKSYYFSVNTLRASDRIQNATIGSGTLKRWEK